MMYGGSARNRFSVDERVIFERLWRGALCQAFGTDKKAALRRATVRRQCCCHCHCLGSDSLNAVNAVPYNSRRNTLRSVVRFVLQRDCFNWLTAILTFD